MTPQIFLQAIATFLHNLFTAAWIGGLVFISLTLLPTTRGVFGNSPQARELMKAILGRHRKFVYISIIGLFITGIVQARAEPAFNGLLHFETLYSSLTSIKHILTFAMVGITLFRSQSLGKKLEGADPRLMKQGVLMIIINASLGAAVLLLSSWMAVI